MVRNNLLWVVLLVLVLCAPLVSAAKITIWNPFGKHLQYYNDATGGSSVINESSNVTGNLNMNSFNVTNATAVETNQVKGWLASVLQLLPATGYYTKVGDAGSTSHGLASNDDLEVTGILEVDGVTYFDGVTNFAANQALAENVLVTFGPGTDGLLGQLISQTPDSMFLGVGAESNSLILAERSDNAYDFGHPQQANPTLFIQSSSQNKSHWGSLAHNTKDFIIDVGNVSSEIVAQNNFTSHNTLNAEADLVVGDQSNQKLWSISANGTNVVIQSFNSALPVEVLTFNSTGGSGRCFMNDSWDWQCLQS